MARTSGLDGVVGKVIQQYQPTPLPSAKAATPAAAKPNVPGDAFVSAPKNQASAPPDANQPAAIPTGNRDYYKQRLADFERRNPGMKPPDYYLSYGDKYCQKFSNLGPKDLSPAGLAWRDKTLKNLQDAIEAKRAADPAGFAQLERDPAAFKAFAFGTHPDAYIQGGLFDLPASDLLKIGTTPELRDLLSPDGIKQVFVCLSKATPKDIGQVGVDTVQNELGHLGIHLPHIELPDFHLPKIHLPF